MYVKIKNGTDHTIHVSVTTENMFQSAAFFDAGPGGEVSWERSTNCNATVKDYWGMYGPICRLAGDAPIHTTVMGLSQMMPPLPPPPPPPPPRARLRSQVGSGAKSARGWVLQALPIRGHARQEGSMIIKAAARTAWTPF